MTDDSRPFYRSVVTNPPTRSDFESNAFLDRPPPRNDPETLKLWNGISSCGSLKRARERAIALPWLGSYVAELRITDRAGITWERTTKSRDHFILWGPSDTLLVLITAVRPVVVLVPPSG